MSKQPTKPSSSSKNNNPSPRKGKNLKTDKPTDDEEDFSDDEDDELNDSASYSKVGAVRLQLLPMSEQIMKQKYPPIKVIDIGILKTSEIILKSIKSVYDICSKSTNNAIDNKKFILKDFVCMINKIEEGCICSHLTTYTNSKWLEILARDMQECVGIVELVTGIKKSSFSLCGKSDAIALTESYNSIQNTLKKHILRYQTETNAFLSKVPDNKYLNTGWKGIEQKVENDGVTISSSLSFLQPKHNNEDAFVERSNITKFVLSSLVNSGDKTHHVLTNSNATRYKCTGKTTLASYICMHAKIQEAYTSDNIFWLSILNANATRREILGTISYRMFNNLIFNDEVPDAYVVTKLKDIMNNNDELKSKRMLLVLDNVSNLVQIVDVLATIFVGTSTRILMTSRNEEMFKSLKTSCSIKVTVVPIFNDENAKRLLAKAAGLSSSGDLNGNLDVPQIIKATEKIPLSLHVVGGSIKYLQTSEDEDTNEEMGARKANPWKYMWEELNEVNALESVGFNEADTNDNFPISIRKALVVSTKMLSNEYRCYLFSISVYGKDTPSISFKVLEILWNKSNDEVKDIVNKFANLNLLNIVTAPANNSSKVDSTQAVNNLFADGIAAADDLLAYPRIEVSKLVMEYLGFELEKIKLTGGARFDSVAAMASIIMLAIDYVKSNNTSHVLSLFLDCSKLLKWTIDMGGKRQNLIERVKKKIDFSLDTLLGFRQHSLLHVAIEEGFLPAMDLLINLGSTLTTVNGDGHSLMEVAGLNGQLNSLQKLITWDKIFNLEKEGEDGLTPLSRYAGFGQEETVKVLAACGAKINSKSKNYGDSTALYIASKNGHANVVKILLENNANVNLFKKDGETALCVAAKNGHSLVIEHLLASNASVNQPTNDGVTPLWYASSKGHVNVVDVLVKNKADIKRSASDGSTALWIAASNGHAGVIRSLQKAGADLNVPNRDGTTPLFAAEAGGNDEAANVLKEFGAKG
jgi:ankyrin repeat protein